MKQHFKNNLKCGCDVHSSRTHILFIETHRVLFTNTGEMYTLLNQREHLTCLSVLKRLPNHEYTHIKLVADVFYLKL